MKKLTAIFTVLLLLAMTIPAMAASAIKDGYHKGIKLCGRVKVVEHFADIKVKYVNSFPGVE